MSLARGTPFRAWGALARSASGTTTAGRHTHKSSTLHKFLPTIFVHVAILTEVSICGILCVENGGGMFSHEDRKKLDISDLSRIGIS